MCSRGDRSEAQAVHLEACSPWSRLGGFGDGFVVAGDTDNIQNSPPVITIIPVVLRAPCKALVAAQFQGTPVGLVILDDCSYYKLPVDGRRAS